MREVLAGMRTLLEKHKDLVSLGVVDHLIALYERDQSEFWSEIQGAEIWGGAGSLADQGMCVVRSPAQGDLQSDRRVFWSLMAELETQMERHGTSTPRARQCADGFRYWVRTGA